MAITSLSTFVTPGAAIYEIAKEYDLAPVWMGHRKASFPVSVSAGLHLVPKVLEEDDELIEAAVHVTDDVERAVLVLQVGPHRQALDGNRLDLFRGVEHEHVPEALAFQSAKRPPELLSLLAHNPRSKRPVGTPFVAGYA